MKQLRRDPIGPLLAADDAALRSLARRELLGESTPEISLAELPGVRRAVARQQPDGRWKYPGGNPKIRSRAAYDQLETYRQLGVLVCKFGLDHHHPAVAAAAAFLSSCQTGAGDYRGIYGHQYTPNYSAAITELLIRAGYGHSAQVENAVRWLLSMRQDDGGWAIPARTPRARLPRPDRFPRRRPRHHPRRGLVHRQPGTRRAVEYRAQPAEGPRQRSVGRARHLPDAQRHQRVTADHAMIVPGCEVPEVPGQVGRCVTRKPRNVQHPNGPPSRGAVAHSRGSATSQPRPGAVGGASMMSDGGTGQMATTNPIDEYLASLDEPKRATLTSVRDTIMAIVPEAEQCISYRMPAFRLRGKTIAGFAAFKDHLSYLPHSGSVIPQLAIETAAYTSTRGSLHFPLDEPLPEALVRKLLEVRMAEAFGKA